MYLYLENDREELVGGRKDQILRQPQLRARIEALLLYHTLVPEPQAASAQGLTTVQCTGTLRMTEKSLLVVGRTRSSGSLSPGPGIEASLPYSVLVP